MIEIDNKLQNLYDSGFTLIEITKKIGKSANYVRRRIKVTDNICEKCGHNFKRHKGNYLKHIIMCNGEGTHEEQKSEPQICKKCSAIIKNAENYRRHIETCDGSGTYLSKKKGPQTCKYCNRIIDKNGNYERHIIHCKKIANIDLQAEYDSGLSVAQIAKKYGASIKVIYNKISNKRSIHQAMKKAKKEEPEKFFYGGTKKTSRGEKVFKQMLEDSGLLEKHKVIQQYNIFNYKLDFAFIDIKLDVEIDGMQHYIKKEIIEKDKKRNSILIENGWTIYRIASKDFLSRPKVIFQTFHDFISNNYKTQELYRYPNQMIDGDKQWFEERKKKILESGINFKERGWTLKLGEFLGIHSNTARVWIQKNMPDFYKNNCFTPKSDYVKRKAMEDKKKTSKTHGKGYKCQLKNKLN